MLLHDAYARQANRATDTKKATPLVHHAHARQANTARSLRRAAEFHPPQTAVSG